jgi:hypothetical protein
VVHKHFVIVVYDSREGFLGQPKQTGASPTTSNDAPPFIVCELPLEPENIQETFITSAFAM